MNLGHGNYIPYFPVARSGSASVASGMVIVHIAEGVRALIFETSQTARACLSGSRGHFNEGSGRY